MTTHQLTDRPTPEDINQAVENFLEWADPVMPFRFVYRREDDRWFALAVDYDITGMGRTLREATEEMHELVLAYLIDYFREGAPLEAAKRPIPLRLRLRIWFDSTMLAHLPIGGDHTPRAGRSSAMTSPSSVKHALVC